MRSPRRLMCASVLGFECVALGLMTPVLITVEDVSTGVAVAIGVGLAVSALVVAGLLRFEWAYYLGFAIQVAALAMGVLLPAMIVLGLVFGALWTTAYVLGRKIEAQQAGIAARSTGG
ncbi:MAG: DUF4233 domain-containing protein [Nocardioidaceae bacterium]